MLICLRTSSHMQRSTSYSCHCHAQPRLSTAHAGSCPTVSVAEALQTRCKAQALFLDLAPSKAGYAKRLLEISGAATYLLAGQGPSEGLDGVWV